MRIITDTTPEYVPQWIIDLPHYEWRSLIDCQSTGTTINKITFNPSKNWRQYGMRPDFKIKVSIDLCNKLENTTRHYVLKGSADSREALFYSVTKDLKCPVLPRINNVWLDHDTDNLNWILMEYYPHEPNSERSAENLISSMACFHSWFLDDAWNLKQQLDWPDSSACPYTAKMELLTSLESIPSLYDQISRAKQLPTIGKKLDRLVSGDISNIIDFYSQKHTITHCDLHPGNYINVKNHKGIVIDWSGVCVNVPFFDLMRSVDYFYVVEGIDEDYLYNVYLKQMEIAVKNQYSLVELKEFISLAKDFVNIISLARYMHYTANNVAYNTDVHEPEWASQEELYNRICDLLQKLD